MVTQKMGKRKLKQMGMPPKFGKGDPTRAVSVRIPLSRYTEWISYEDKWEIVKAGFDVLDGKPPSINSNSLDTKLLKLMILPFVKNGIKVKLEPEQIKRIKTLYKEITA